MDTQNNEAQLAQKKKINTSGKGKNAPVPKVIANNFNWGACFLSFIWGIGNKTYITFLIIISCIIPLLPIVLMIWFGKKGNVWAWQNKRWKGIGHFNRVQRIWGIVGFILFIISMIFTLSSMSAITSLLTGKTPAKQGAKVVVEKTQPSKLTDEQRRKLEMGKNIDGMVDSEVAQMRRTAIALIQRAFTDEHDANRPRAIDNKDLSADNLAKFANNYIKGTLDNNIIYSYGFRFVFYSDGKCATYGESMDCYIKVDINGSEFPNQDGVDIMYIPLEGVVQENGVGVSPRRNVLDSYSQDKVEKKALNHSFVEQSYLRARQITLFWLQDAVKKNFDMNRNLENNPNPKALADYFAEGLKEIGIESSRQDASTLLLKDTEVKNMFQEDQRGPIVINFEGSKCEDENSCYMNIDINGSIEPNKDQRDQIKIRIQRVEQDGKYRIKINHDDSNKYVS